jgi:hypothetical protein
MKTCVMTMYVSIETETEEEAWEIAFTLDVVPKNEVDRGKIYYGTQNPQVEEAPF